jgi:phosphate transport system substrate-binding protein
MGEKKKNWRKIVIGSILGVVLMFGLAGCGSGSKSGFDSAREITVVSREAGSGTRGAFIELMGVEEKDANGNKTDHTTTGAVIANKTDVVMTNVAGDPYAIGYISLGSLNNNVKAVSIDGVAASAENVKNGTYKAARPFNIATKGKPSPLAQDFIDYIMSAEGQKIIAGGYIAVDEKAAPFTGAKPAGKLAIAGSSSVSPIMEKLVEAYLLVNPNVNIEIQTSDSTAGMTGANAGTCDIGMASRALKDSELKTLTPLTIALDGIAVIVNKENPATDLTSAQVKAIYIGETKTWDSL